MANQEPVIYTDLQGKVGFVTGGGSNIGRAITIRMARQGMFVATLDVDEAGMRETKRIIMEEGQFTYEPMCILGSTAKEDDVRMAISGTLAQATLKVGNQKGLDVVVNNAGIGGKEQEPLTRVSHDERNRLHAVNIQGYENVQVHAGRTFEAQAAGRNGRYEDGSIIYIISEAGLLGSEKNYYGVTNAARIGLGRQALLEMAHLGVRVNFVTPGDIVTGSKLWEGGYAEGRAKAKGVTVSEVTTLYETRGNLGVRSTADQVAQAVLYFSSRLASENTTGALLSCGGGRIHI